MLLFLTVIAQLVPWYLFPGAGKSVTSAAKPDSAVVATIPAQPVEEEEPTSDTISVCLAMPFRAGSEPKNKWAFDFYCGALQAAYDLDSTGTKLRLDVFDVFDSTGTAVNFNPEAYDIVLGPVNPEDVRAVCAKCPDWQYVISPLDSRCSALTDSCNVIQVPTSQDVQSIELVEWLREEFDPLRDSIIVINGSDGPKHNFCRLLTDAGLPFRAVPTSHPLDSMCAMDGTTRFLIESDNEAIVSDEIRRVAVLSMQRFKVALYCLSKPRSYENFSVELLHSSNARMITTYNIDYSDEGTNRFVLGYRNNFKCEPSQFAFHGYDCLNFFVQARSELGSQWRVRLGEMKKAGLQADFNFTGPRNEGTRRVVYNPDFSITCQK